MWARNNLWWLAAAVLLAWIKRSWRFAAVFFLLFFGANIVQIAVWDWDQIKIFLALYLLMLSFWSVGERKGQWYAHWLLAVLLVPGLFEGLVTLRHYQLLTVYSKDAIGMAVDIARHTPEQAIIAAAPNHNSVVTLTGRKLFYGYEGTLSSHGIDYQARRAQFLNLDGLVRCRIERNNYRNTVCPDFLLWTEAEQRYWKRTAVPDGLQSTALPFLYRLPDPPSAAGAASGSLRK
jgi:hypothetical protein